MINKPKSTKQLNNPLKQGFFLSPLSRKFLKTVVSKNVGIIE